MGVAIEAFLKSRRSWRDVPLPDFGWEALRIERNRTLERGEQPQGDLLVWYRRDNQPLAHPTMLSHWYAFAKGHGLPKIRLHDLRHTTAGLLYATYGDLKLVQDLLGHASIQTTADTYARGRADERMQDAARRYQEVVDGKVRVPEGGQAEAPPE